MKRNIRLFLGFSAAIAASAFAACQSDASGPAPDPVGDPAPVSTALEKLHVGPATTLASAVEPARVAFTAKGGAYTGGWATHSARIVDGIVEMTPSTYDRALGTTITGGT